MHAQGFLLTYNREEPPLTEADYDGFAAWIEGPFTEKHKLWRVSHTFERCPETNNMHIHAFIEFKTRIDWPTTDNVVWMNVRPNVQANWNSIEEGLNSRARGFVRLSLDGGHYYTFVDKIGSIRSGGNYRPFKHYAPRPEKTIDRWWSQGKISDDVVLLLVLLCAEDNDTARRQRRQFSHAGYDQLVGSSSDTLGVCT